MNAWQEYKKKLGDTRPWDLLNPNSPRSNESQYKHRIALCSNCDRIIKTTFQCRECGCFMKMKAQLEKATCPLGKW
jgi:hypothetical protein